MGFAKCKEKRRVQRYTNVLAKLFNVKFSECPTQNLAICNGGLANGLSQERIIEHMSAYGIIQSVNMPSGHSVSFVRFQSVEGSTLAYDATATTKPLDWEGGGPAFLIYVENIPEESAVEEAYSNPPGLTILNNFVTEEEEQAFLECIAMEDSASNLKHRAVKHFGYEFRYSDNRADVGGSKVAPIPHVFSVLWGRLHEQTGIEFDPDQCTVNRYCPGQGIPPHVDTHSAFSEVIVCLSLQADVVMDWRQSDLHRHVLVPRRSLSLFTGDARYGWTHGITPRKSDVVTACGTSGLTLVPRKLRTSVTFRRTRTGPCSPCPHPALCDSLPSVSKPTDSLAAKLESTSVHQVYEEIAEHFSMTRHKPWPNVVKFLNTFQTGDIVLDVGCGNGKYLGVLADLAMVGLDRSASLLQLCIKAYPDRDWLTQADCLCIPARDASADGVISIAVLHHLSTHERRVKSVSEMVRVLRPGGRALIYVWAKNQEADSIKSTYLRQRKPKPVQEILGEKEVEGVILPVHTNRTNFSSSDMLVPWQEKKSGTTFLRYYHVFEEPELRELCAQVPKVLCKDYYYDQGNWCIILEKE